MVAVPSSVESSLNEAFNQNILNQADDWESFVSLWTICDEAEQLVNWYRGDIACRVAVKYGEQSLKKFAQEVGVSYRTLIAYRRTSRAFDLDNRLSKLTWTHHFTASQVDPWDKGKQKFLSTGRFSWTERAHDENWSVGKLRLEIAHNKAKENEDLYQFYLEAVRRFGRIITHWEIDELSNDERKGLAVEIDKVVQGFKDYLSIS